MAPPQQGVFPVPYPSSSHHIQSSHSSSHFKPPVGSAAPDIYTHPTHIHHSHASTSRIHHSHHSIDDGKKEKRRRELAGKLGKEMSDRRDDGRHVHETISALHTTVVQLATHPDTSPLYNLRLLPLTLQRSALLAQAESEERHGLERAQNAYDEERERVEEELRKGRERVRERLLEGIEERRKRAREEKEGEGTSGDGAMDSSSRPHITRKLRNKFGTSPPPTPLGSTSSSIPHSGLISSLPITSGPFLNPHSLSVDELPSPFPLPLTSTTTPAVPQSGGGAGQGGRRRHKGNGAGGQQIFGQLGKSLLQLGPCKEGEIESDLNEIRRGNKRRRATAVALGRLGVV